MNLRVFECDSCGSRTMAAGYPGRCSRCGSRMMNISVRRE